MSNINISSAQIELFVALTETGSFSEAAKALQLTQSAVSHGLARMESELGVVLIERGRRGIHLTPTGTAILSHAREVLARMDTIRQISTTAQGEARGKLRLGIAQPLPPTLLTGIVQHFRNQYPGVELVIIEDILEGEKNWLSEGRIDAAITSSSLPGTDAFPLATEEIQVVLPTAHALSSQAAISFNELIQEPLIVPRFGREWIAEIFRNRESKDERPQVRHFVSDTRTVIAMVKAKLGLALVPRSAIEEMLPHSPELTSRPLSPALQLPLSLATRSGDGASPIAKAFIECATAWAKSL